MESISVERRNELIAASRHMLKLELRDNYKIDLALLEAWRAGDKAPVEASYLEWRDVVAAQAAEGKTLRRVRVVSEPLSEYQQMAVEFSGPAVEAGEDLRWLPRRLVSTVPLPGNDCFVLDGETVMFNVLGGDDDRGGVQFSRDPAIVKSCTEAFETAWDLAVPHHDYKPAA